VAKFLLNAPVTRLPYASLTGSVPRAILETRFVFPVCFKAESTVCGVERKMCRLWRNIISSTSLWNRNTIMVNTGAKSLITLAGQDPIVFADDTGTKFMFPFSSYKKLASSP